MALTKVPYSMIAGAPVSVQDYGAVGDGVTDDTAAIQAAFNTGKTVYFPKANYRIFSNLTVSSNNQLILLNGATLIFRNPASYGTADPATFAFTGQNITVDMGGGTFTQMVGYAKLAFDTTPGASSLIVTDASTLYNGQTLVSSWGEMAVEPSIYPLGGPITAYNLRRTITISGNTITLSAPMNGTAAFLPTNTYVGEWSFSQFVTVSGGGTVKFYNGVWDRIQGYYYHTPSISNGESIVFDGITFAGNGLDQFLIYNNQKLYFNGCVAAQPWDYAKSGIWLDGSASVYMSNCNMRLGNFDASINIAGTREALNGGEIFISDSQISGASSLPLTSGQPFTQNTLHFIEHRAPGVFNNILVSNSRISDFTRYFYSGTVLSVPNSISLNSLQVDNCKIDGSFSSFIIDGAGKSFTLPIATISNTSFSQSNNFDFYSVSAINGATFSARPKFDNCFFKLNNTSATFNAPAVVSDSTFSATPYSHRFGFVEMDNCLFQDGSTIAITPTFDENFYGELNNIVIDSDSYPLSPGSVFTALGGTALSGAKIASARSVNGSVYYDVYKLSSDILVSGTFVIANGTYKLRGDDWYIPRGSRIYDMYTGQTFRVSFNLATTLTTAAVSADTSIVVASATGVTVGDKVNIYLNDDLVTTSTVAGSYGGGTTIPLTTAVGESADIGNNVNFFRVV